MNVFLFWLFGLVTCGGAALVVIEKSVVRMAFWLVVALGGVAGLFFLLEADVLGATQLLIYVGGTVVLLIFGVMLTATGPAAGRMTIMPSERILATLLALCLLGVFSVSVLAADWDRVTVADSAYAAGGTARPLGLKLLGFDADALAGRPGNGSGYLLPFEIASVHLLVVLVGAAYLARAKRRRS